MQEHDGAQRWLLVSIRYLDDTDTFIAMKKKKKIIDNIITVKTESVQVDNFITFKLHSRT